MLINKIRDTYREITGFIEPVIPVSVVSSHCPAANADHYTASEKQARRQRRQRRTELGGLRNVSGWTVRTW